MAQRAGRSIMSPSAYLRRQGFYRGWLGGSRFWMLVGGAAWATRTFRRTFGKNVEIAAVEYLKPGQFVKITAIRPPSRSERKAARRSKA